MVIQLWRDVNTNFHLVRGTRDVPVIVEDEGELKQLDGELLTKVKGDVDKAKALDKKGWYSSLLERFVRSVKLREGTKWVKKRIYLNEVLFVPDNRDMRVAISHGLRLNFEKHKTLPWWREPAVLGLASVGMIVVLMIVIGYFMVDAWKFNIDRSVAGIEASKQANKYLFDTMVMVGRDPLIVAQGGSVVGNYSEGGGG